MAHLTWTDGQIHQLAEKDISLGRDAGCDVSFPSDKRASRRHAELQFADGQWRIVDLQSRNGTFVNDRRVRDHPLVSGDRIRIGTSEIRYVSDADPHATEIALGAEGGVVQLLSERERGVVALVAEGLTDKDIAARLFISASTVRSHLDRIAEKTGLRRRSELTRMAVENGLLEQGS